jgi:hypothetical protein
MIMASKLYGYRWLMYCPENEPVGDLMIDIAEMYCGYRLGIQAFYRTYI